MTSSTDATTDTLVVSEVFGPTFQGEGPHTGQRVGFIRLGGCNLHCTWCDTAYTWDANRYDLRAELNRWTVEDIATQVDTMNVDRVVISGGEPLLHQNQPAWLQLLDLLDNLGVLVDVETNGTITPTSSTRDGVDLFVVSPKLAHAGDPAVLRIVPQALRAFAELAEVGAAAFKVVCRHSDDVALTRALLVEEYEVNPRHVWVMPEGATPTELLGHHHDVADAALSYRLNFTTRLHLLLWGPERAR